MPKTSKRGKTKAKPRKAPRKAKMPAAGKSPARTFRKLTTGQDAANLIAKAKALATRQLDAMTPQELAAAISVHEATRQQRDNLERFNLFGDFDPTPIAGRQRRLFDDATNVTTEAPWPVRSTVSPTWPRPWAKSTPADARIARQYKAEGTPELF